MATPAARAFLLAEIEALEPFGFVLVSPAANLLHALEIGRTAEGGLEVRVPGRPPVLPELPLAVRSALRERGFASSDPADRGRPWLRAASDAGAAVDLLERVLVEAFEEKPEAPLDVTHGSHRAEHEAQERLAAVRARIERVLQEKTGGRPEQDPDADYTMQMGNVHVTVAPRAAPGGPIVVRVFAITNVGVNVTPDLGLFLARLNFGLMFGRFALDTDHSAIWFDETLLGEQFSDEELRFTIGVVASTAGVWGERLKQMFGGSTYQEVLEGRSSHERPPVKPGGGGYL